MAFLDVAPAGPMHMFTDSTFGAILFVALIALVVIAIIVVVLLCVRRGKKKKEAALAAQQAASVQSAPDAKDNKTE